MIRRELYPSEQDLKGVFDATTVWVKEHGKLEVDPSVDLTGSHNGLLIIENGPIGEVFSIDPLAIERYLPQAVQTFSLAPNKPLEIQRNWARYCRTNYQGNYSENDLTYADPSVTFRMRATHEEHEFMKAIDIGPWTSETGAVRFGVYRDYDAIPGVEPIETMFVHQGEQGSLQWDEYTALTGLVGVLYSHRPSDLRTAPDRSQQR